MVKFPLQKNLPIQESIEAKTFNTIITRLNIVALSSRNKNKVSMPQFP